MCIKLSKLVHKNIDFDILLYDWLKLLNYSLKKVVMSLPDLREPFYLSLWLGQVVIWVGILVFYFFVGRVWFPIRGSCLLLSLIGNHT